MAENSIINSYLYKIGDSTEFFKVEDLIKEIHQNLKEDRELINVLLKKALSDSDDLKSDILTFNEIKSLPSMSIFEDIPNKYLDNLNNNASNYINLMNAIQRLQVNYINKTRNKKNPEKGEMSVEELLNSAEE